MLLRVACGGVILKTMSFSWVPLLNRQTLSRTDITKGCCDRGNNRFLTLSDVIWGFPYSRVLMVFSELVVARQSHANRVTLGTCSYIYLM